MAKATQAGSQDQAKIAQKAKEASDKAAAKAKAKSIRKQDRRNNETFKDVESGASCPHKVAPRHMTKKCPDYKAEAGSDRCVVCKRIPQF
jgi:hypothetical protein